MSSKIILKKSSVAAKAPVAADLAFGELAINYTDSKLYFKKADGSIDAFTSAAASAPVTSVGGNIGDITDAQLLASIKNVDGAGSGLDADTLDGLNSSSFYLASNPSGYTSNTGTVTSVGATSPVVSSGGTTPTISIPAATASVDGFMTAAYASKLDGIAAGATANTGTVTSVGGTGGYGGLTLSGTVTTSGNLTLGGTPTGSWPISVTGSSASTTGNAATVTNGVYTAGDQTIAGSKNFTSRLSNIPTSGWSTFYLGGQFNSYAWFHVGGESGSNELRIARTDRSFNWQQNVLNLDLNNGNVNTPGTITAAGFSGNATSATFLNSSNYINRTGSSGNLNTDFQNTPAGSTRIQGDEAGQANNPGGTWWFYQNMRHSNSSNFWGTQVAWGWEDNANRLRTRNVTANSFGGWVEYLNTAGHTFSGNLTMSGNVTANSDERLKKDWQKLPSDFIYNLSKVKTGTYTRTDSDERQAGSSAQDWQKLLPEVVQTANDEDKTLSLAYGNAALVSAVELAKKVVEQEERIKKLEELISKLIAD